MVTDPQTNTHTHTDRDNYNTLCHSLVCSVTIAVSCNVGLSILSHSWHMAIYEPRWTTKSYSKVTQAQQWWNCTNALHLQMPFPYSVWRGDCWPRQDTRSHYSNSRGLREIAGLVLKLTMCKINLFIIVCHHCSQWQTWPWPPTAGFSWHAPHYWLI